jgi:hypothetical protein
LLLSCWFVGLGGENWSLSICYSGESELSLLSKDPPRTESVPYSTGDELLLALVCRGGGRGTSFCWPLEG